MDIYMTVGNPNLQKNHRLTYGLTLNFLQTPIAQALNAFLAILMQNPGLTEFYNATQNIVVISFWYN
jgi:predicted nucleic-acid-binding Zn-ribbon protein